jgi:hypothetical protein
MKVYYGVIYFNYWWIASEEEFFAIISVQELDDDFKVKSTLVDHDKKTYTLTCHSYHLFEVIICKLNN